MFRASVLLLAIMIAGMVGYRWFGGPEATWLDAMYMTVVTLTTVGYREIIDLTHSPGGRIFTVLLLMAGVGTFLFFFSRVTAFLIEGHLDKVWWRRRMQKRLRNAHGHTIVCGLGTTGHYIVRELVSTHRSLVLVDEDEQAIMHQCEQFQHEFASVIGDATDDDVLREAGIERATGLIACTHADKDNLIIAMSARLINPNLRIVCRCDDEGMEAKIRKAGANSVVRPDFIGGMRMISEMVRPTVVSFLDIMLRDKEHPLRIEAVRVQPGSKLDGMSVGELRQASIADALVMALAMGNDSSGAPASADDAGLAGAAAKAARQEAKVREQAARSITGATAMPTSATTSWEYNPPDNHKLTPGVEVVFMGGPSAREALESLATS